MGTKITLERIQRLISQKAYDAKVQMEVSKKKENRDFNCGLFLGFDLAARLITMVLEHQNGGNKYEN